MIDALFRRASGTEYRIRLIAYQPHTASKTFPLCGKVFDYRKILYISTQKKFLFKKLSLAVIKLFIHHCVGNGVFFARYMGEGDMFIILPEIPDINK